MNNSIKGEKRLCSNCGLKFFDLNKRPIVCPRCKHEFMDKEIGKDKNLVKNQMDEENQLHADKDIIQDEGDENNIDILEEDSDDETTTIINID